jgi:phosphoribosylformylglycinamidine synthase
MQVYKGVTALSDFRKDKLLKRLKAINKDTTGISAEYIHFVNISGKLSKQDESHICKLLTYASPFNEDRGGELFLVVPRPGTISPWSSKATDIAKNSGLTNVNRIERGTAYYVHCSSALKRPAIAAILHDRMTETVLGSINEAAVLFVEAAPKPLITINVLKEGADSLKKVSKALGMALAEDEVEYLSHAYKQLKRNPTDAELMTFAQVNSEHCRHKIFNANWVVDGKDQPKSLFQMIKNTNEKAGDNVLSAYSDNAAVLRGPDAAWFFPINKDKVYHSTIEPANLVIKVETHNHPVAVEPFSGAATGVGGEIRDEAATGRGGRSKMGLTGVTVSDLHIPGSPRPWEKEPDKPERIASSLDIIINAPIGAAAFANEFGRPNLAGYFRTYEESAAGQTWGYHKPLLIAGGVGNIRRGHVEKRRLPVGAQLVVLGGPSMLIGLGGGSGASMNNGESSADLDFASVQRGNGEMERRDQEVINACWALGDKNPIISIHDVGAGGWCNSLPELAHDSARGAVIELRDLPNADPGMSPMEIWCNESQERYVLGIAAEDMPTFTAICERERCPFAVAGQATKQQHLIVTDRHFGNKPVDLPLSVLFGKPPKMTRKFAHQSVSMPAFDPKKINLTDAVKRVLRLPAVGSKKFLITIGDRTVGGLTVRDQMVGPWQVPASDLAVTASAFSGSTGEAMSMGERPPLALINAPASGRMAVGEALINIVAASINKISDVKLSANWMAAAGTGQEDEHLFETVKSIGEDFCPKLGITIPVGKDSLSMRTVWQDGTKDKSVTSPVSLIITAFSPVTDVDQTLTPELQMTEDTTLILLDLGRGQNRLGGSALAQVYNQIGNTTPDIEADQLKKFFGAIQSLKRQNKILAYHDRSDGGLLTTLCEMAFASRCGLDIDISNLSGNVLGKLFNEELGAVIQVKASHTQPILEKLQDVLGKDGVCTIGKPTKNQQVRITENGQLVYQNSRAELEQFWAETSYQIQSLRDNPTTSAQEFAAIKSDADSGLVPKVTFKPVVHNYKAKPKVAIFREQGVNGQVEMAAAFDRAGFTSVDVHLNDLLKNTVSLDDFVGLAACGGFSYGDVLGAGEGWAKTILFDKKLHDKFSEFFARENTFSLGVCNGCQMLAALKELIPGADIWPKFLKNKSEQFEARLTLTKVNESPSLFFKGMAGSYLPIPVAHGEGRVAFASDKQAQQAIVNKLVPMQYVDSNHEVTEQYPSNPNGSLYGITALTTPDGRATIMMPHPERAFMTRQLSWHPKTWGPDSPWLNLFQNAREWCSK